MRSRYLMELTTPEIEDYLSGTETTAILPVGSVEMHGPHQPTGTDTLVAKAFALRVAEEADGLVLPEMQYSWSGSTDGFKGTISIGIDLEQEIVETIAVKASGMGFTRVVILNIHGPNDEILYLSVRKIFERYHIPVLYINAFRPFNDNSSRIFEGEYGKSKEASVLLAALQILGEPELYTEEKMRYDDEAPAYPAEQWRLSRMGGIGYFMQDPRQHACPSRFVSLQKGLEFIDCQVKHIVSELKELDAYRAVIEKQKNKGLYA